MLRYIDTSVTLNKNFICFEHTKSNKSNVLLKDILTVLSELESRGIVLTRDVFKNLLHLNRDDIEIIFNEILKNTQNTKGIFLRPVFASKEDIADEKFTVEDLITQVYMYFNTYSLGRVPKELLEGVGCNNRKTEIPGDSEKKSQELNNKIRYIDYKDFSNYKTLLKEILNSPIVFGEQQIKLIQEGENNGLLEDLLPNVNFKVKENLFAIIDIIGKQKFKELNLLKTPTDVLRYAFYVSDLDYRGLNLQTEWFSSQKIRLKTSDKKVIMDTINKFSYEKCYEEMKPRYSQWIALTRALYPGSKKFNKFHRAQNIFNRLRDGEKTETFNTQKSKLIKDKNVLELTKLLSNRPGELLRNIDFIIRNIKENNTDEFIKIIQETSFNPKLVLEVKAWLSFRKETSIKERVINVSGKPVKVDEKPLKKLDADITRNIIQILSESLDNHLTNKDLFPAIEIEKNIQEVK